MTTAIEVSKVYGSVVAAPPTACVSVSKVYGSVVMALPAEAVGGADPDTSAPVVSNVTPASGTPVDENDPLGFDVTDDSNVFRQTLLHARYPSKSTWEVIHDGIAFAPVFAAGSTRVSIAGGFRYSLRRAGGWPGDPTIYPVAIDRAGNENA